MRCAGIAMLRGYRKRMSSLLPKYKFKIDLFLSSIDDLENSLRHTASRDDENVPQATEKQSDDIQDTCCYSDCRHSEYVYQIDRIAPFKNLRGARRILRGGYHFKSEDGKINTQLRYFSLGGLAIQLNNTEAITELGFAGLFENELYFEKFTIVNKSGIRCIVADVEKGIVYIFPWQMAILLNKPDLILLCFQMGM